MAEQSIKIILAGALGRMGRTIMNDILESPAFDLAGALEMKDNLVNAKKLPCLVSYDLNDLISAVKNPVVIDFTEPEASLKNASICAAAKIPLVIGTTGFTMEQKKQLEKFAAETPIFWSANMSVGINVLLEILPLISRLLGPDYDMEIMEIHHKRKKDAPSGTALMLGDALAKSRGWNLDTAHVSKRDGIIGERQKEEIGIQALRGGDVVGIHSTYFLGPGEIIEVTHQAESRENFSRGALRAAAWLSSHKPGKLYSMQDVLGIANGKF